jgi:hypothetical protein
MERETRLEALRRRADDVRLEILLDAAEIAERRRRCIEIAELDRRAADPNWVHIGAIIPGVLENLINGVREDKETHARTD